MGKYIIPRSLRGMGTGFEEVRPSVIYGLGFAERTLLRQLFVDIIHHLDVDTLKWQGHRSDKDVLEAGRRTFVVATVTTTQMEPFAPCTGD